MRVPLMLRRDDARHSISSSSPVTESCNGVGELVDPLVEAGDLVGASLQVVAERL
jgi:hypothetical protein